MSEMRYFFLAASLVCLSLATHMDVPESLEESETNKPGLESAFLPALERNNLRDLEKGAANFQPPELGK